MSKSLDVANAVAAIINGIDLGDGVSASVSWQPEVSLDSDVDTTQIIVCPGSLSRSRAARGVFEVTCDTSIWIIRKIAFGGDAIDSSEVDALCDIAEQIGYAMISSGKVDGGLVKEVIHRPRAVDEKDSSLAFPDQLANGMFVSALTVTTYHA